MYWYFISRDGIFTIAPNGIGLGEVAEPEAK